MPLCELALFVVISAMICANFAFRNGMQRSVDASCYERGATAIVHLQQGAPATTVKLDNLVIGFDNGRGTSAASCISQVLP